MMNTPISLVSLWAFVALMMATSSLLPCSAVDPKTIAAICSKTFDPTKCQVNLANDPRTSKADLNQLLLVSLDLAQEKNAVAFQMYDNFIRNGTWPGFRTFYELCTSVTQKVAADLKEAQKILHQKWSLSITPVLVHSNATAVLCTDHNPTNSAVMNSVDMALKSSVETNIAINNYIIANDNLMI